jgi:hypothetical protein
MESTGGAMTDVALPPIESAHLAAVGYRARDCELIVEFKNGDAWEYYNVSEDVHTCLMKHPSPGSFFAGVVRPCFEGRQIHVGTIDDRARIWLRSAEAKDFAGSWVMLVGNPVRVGAWAETKEIVDSVAAIGEQGTAVIVEVPKETSVVEKVKENERRYMQWVNGGMVGPNPLPGPGITYGQAKKEKS